MKYHIRQKCQMVHSTKRLSKVCTQECKQNAKNIEHENTLKEDIQKVQTEDIQKITTEAGPHTDMASTQQYKKKFFKKNI